jgi:MoxR-like ATPase
MRVVVGYPTDQDELGILYRMGQSSAGGRRPHARPVLDTAKLIALQARANRVFVHHALAEYVVRLVLATRDPARFGLPELAGQLAYGASPRATLGLVAAGRALALLRGRDYVLPNDILDIAPDVLAHRLVLSFDAVADGVPAETLVHRILESVPLPTIAPAQEQQGPGLGIAA